jgi:hypothetical protein
VRLQHGANELRALLTDLTAYEQWAPAPTTIEPLPGSDAETIVLRVTDDDTKSLLQWEWRVAGDDAHSVVTLTESGRVGNPVIRFFAALRGHGGNAERTLRALAEHLNEFGVSVERL